MSEESALAAAARARAFAEQQLGPASAIYLAAPETMALVLGRWRGGRALEDAVLGEVFRGAAKHRELADEFIALFLADLQRLGHLRLSAGLRRFLDTGDLVQSVLGDLWQDVQKVRFESRPQFLAYLAQALRWKSGTQAQRLAAGNRREDQRAEQPVEEAAAGGARPESLAGQEEERERLALVLLRLPQRDRELLTHYLRGESQAQLAERLGLSADAVRMGVQRAVARARALLG